MCSDCSVFELVIMPEFAHLRRCSDCSVFELVIMPEFFHLRRCSERSTWISPNAYFTVLSLCWTGDSGRVFTTGIFCWCIKWFVWLGRCLLRWLSFRKNLFSCVQKISGVSGGYVQLFFYTMLNWLSFSKSLLCRCIKIHKCIFLPVPPQGR